MAEKGGRSTSEGSAEGSSVASAPKTPVSLLQEVYVKRGITPKYDLVQIEGAVHEPTFKYRVTVGEFVATGSGQSKKKAKHSAARAVLERMRHAQSKAAANDKSSCTALALVTAELADLDISKTEILSPYDDGIEGNPVGELQELCMNRRMPPPGYDVSLEEGQPHERKFVIVCSVGKQQVSYTLFLYKSGSA
jgi:RISC-loading complex subunit TARBP2